jgi:UDP-N-acetylmuramate dehydrogenase
MGRGGGALPQASRIGLVRRGRVKIEEGVALSRMTTVGIGGPARTLARPRTLTELQDALAWADERGLVVRPIGLGSNLLAADAGVDALVVRLEGELAAVETRGTVLIAGGGAPNAVCLHRARAAGLGGFEFACAIPGTAGGGVRMNAGAYGSDWKAILVRALVVDATGARWHTNDELDLSYRHSALVPGQVVAQVEFRLAVRSGAEIKETVAAMQARRKETQPTNKRTFGSVFKNPDHELGTGRMIELCGLMGHRIGGATISPRHGNFIENAGGATAGEAIALMVEARERVLDRFGVVLEREVELLGELELPPVSAKPG